MTSFKKLMLSAMAGLALLMASNAHAAYINPDVGYSGSQITANFRTVSGAATMFEGDDAHFSFALPFAFNFYGSNYAAGWISTNGLLGFDALDDNDPKQLEGYCCDAFLSKFAPLNTIHAGWFDMFGQVYTQTDGVAGSREFVITWHTNEYDASDEFGIGAPNLFQVILHETSNDIEFQYDQLNNLRHHATVGGIKGGDDSDGLSFVDFSEDVRLSNLGLSIHFNPDDVVVPQGVPEPGSVALLGLAFGALALSRRFWKRARAE